MAATLYDFEARSLQGEPIKLSRYEGKVVLVVNTASKCGLTPQYKGLEELYRAYGEQGLVVLGFPCNQFAGQEPGDAKEIAEGCLINYGVSFPVFEKIEVNGEGAHPLFTWLRGELHGWFGDKVKWNFTKFLIGRDGRPLKRFAPATKPEKLRKPIERALKG